MNKNSKVTLCMITKDEEKNIVCCINSVRHLIDEIIIVDTGSSDGTIGKALQAGAKVFNFNWQYNFSQARNFGLEQADGEWLLVLDADEVLEYIDVGRFSNLLVNTHIEGYFVNVESYIGNGSEKIVDQTVRLFRNRPNYRFFGAIHEQVAGSIRANNKGIGLISTELKIIHSGYLNKTVEEKNKHFRNMEVINRALIDTPNNPFLRYSLGIEYLQQGVVTEGNEQLIKALQHLAGDETYFCDVVMTLAAGLLQTGALLPMIKEVINNISFRLPKTYKLLLLKGIDALYDHDYETAVQLLQKSVIVDYIT